MKQKCFVWIDKNKNVFIDDSLGVMIYKRHDVYKTKQTKNGEKFIEAEISFLDEDNTK